MSKTKEPEKNREQDKTTEDEILGLIQLIDDNSKNERGLFRKSNVFKGWIRIIIGLIVLVIVVTLMNTFDSSLLPYTVFLPTLLTIFAVFVTVLSLIVQTAEGSILETRFDRALKLRTSFMENQKLILKALIKIRSKHPEFALKVAYDMNKEMFTEKRLLEKLYE